MGPCDLQLFKDFAVCAHVQSPTHVWMSKNPRFELLDPSLVACRCVCLCVCVCVCVCVCSYAWPVHRYIYINACIHTYIPQRALSYCSLSAWSIRFADVYDRDRDRDRDITKMKSVKGISSMSQISGLWRPRQGDIAHTDFWISWKQVHRDRGRDRDCDCDRGHECLLTNPKPLLPSIPVQMKQRGVRVWCFVFKLAGGKKSTAFSHLLIYAVCCTDKMMSFRALVSGMGIGQSQKPGTSTVSVVMNVTATVTVTVSVTSWHSCICANF